MLLQVPVPPYFCCSRVLSLPLPLGRCHCSKRQTAWSLYSHLRIGRSGPRREEWEGAPDANYETNEDLGLVCANEPYNPKGCTELLNSTNVQSDILDFWGEGRIAWEGVITGFSNSYNVNHQYKLVSPSSADFNRCIPNRIPTESFDNSDIQAYVESDTFRFVTLMGSPIHELTAQEMARVVRKDDVSMIILYGVDLSTHVNAFEAAAATIHFTYDPFSSLLSTEIPGLEPVSIPDHPTYTRVYHTARAVKYRTLSQSECRAIVGSQADMEHSEELAQPGFYFLGYRCRDKRGSVVFWSGQISIDNGIVQSIVKTGNSTAWIYAGTGFHSSFICPEGFVLVGRLSRSDDGGGVWYKCAPPLMCRTSIGDVVHCETHNISKWIRHDQSKDNDNNCLSPGAILVGLTNRGMETWHRYTFVSVKPP